MRGRFLEWLRAPALIRPFSRAGGVGVPAVSLRTSPRYAILTIDGLDLYFLRETGRLDGWGRSVGVSEPASGTEAGG